MKIMYRNATFLTELISKDGSLQRPLVAQLYRMLAAMPVNQAWIESVYRQWLAGKYPDMPAEDVDAKAVSYAGVIAEWAQTVSEVPPSVPVPGDSLGLLRPVDALIQFFHAADPAVVRNMLGQVVQEVRDALVAAHKLDYEQRIKQAMGQPHYTATIQQIRALQGLRARINDDLARFEQELIKWAQEQVGSPLVRLYGEELRIQAIETADRKTDVPHAAPKPQYLQVLPVSFETTRADVGDKPIRGRVDKGKDGIICVITYNGEVFEGKAPPLSKAPASAAARVAMRALVAAKGGNPDNVSYNWPKMFKWARVDGPEKVDGTKEEADD